MKILYLFIFCMSLFVFPLNVLTLDPLLAQRYFPPSGHWKIMADGKRGYLIIDNKPEYAPFLQIEGSVFGENFTGYFYSLDSEIIFETEVHENSSLIHQTFLGHFMNGNLNQSQSLEQDCRTGGGGAEFFSLAGSFSSGGFKDNKTIRPHYGGWYAEMGHCQYP